VFDSKKKPLLTNSAMLTFSGCDNYVIVDNSEMALLRTNIPLICLIYKLWKIMHIGSYLLKHVWHCGISFKISKSVLSKSFGLNWGLVRGKILDGKFSAWEVKLAHNTSIQWTRITLNNPIIVGCHFELCVATKFHQDCHHILVYDKQLLCTSRNMK
jgi:hypothetical protein